LGFGESAQSLLCVFSKLAVDLAWRELGAVQQNLQLDDNGIDSVGRQLCAVFRFVDGCSVQAGARGRKRQPNRQNRSDQQANHPATSSKNP